MTLPVERFKDSYQNWRYNPFTDTDMATDAEEDGLIIPGGAPFIIQLLEVPRKNDPTSVIVRCYGVDTTVDETSAAGQKVLKVAATAGFAQDDTIIINRGGAREEEKIVDTIQAGISLTVTVNLANEHTAGQADIVEKYIPFAEAGGAPAQSQFRVDYPPDDGEGTGLIEFNTNDANKEVRVNYKATGSPMTSELLDTKVSYPTGAPGAGQVAGFIDGAPQWKDNPEPHVLISNRHTAAGLTIGHVVRASAAAVFAFAQLQHDDLGGVGVNDHHAQAHSLASHSSKAHSELTGVTANLHHAQIHALTTHSDFATYLNQAVKTTSNITHNSGIFNGKLSFGNATELTISGGVITVTRSYHIVDTEGDDPSDNLITINGGVDGMILFLRAANSSRTISVFTSGNIALVGGGNKLLSSMYSTITLLYDVGRLKWMQVGHASENS